MSVPDAPVYYLKREGNLLSIFTGAPTAVGADVVENPVLDISLAGRELKVKGSSLQALRLYDTDGRMLVRQPPVLMRPFLWKVCPLAFIC